MKIIFTFFVSVIFLFASTDDDLVKKLYFKSYDYEQMGKYSEAIKVLSPLYAKYPKGYTLNLRFGWLFYLDKKYNDALKYYKNASLINTYSLDPKLGIIRTYLDIYEYKKAQQIAYEVLKLDYYNYYANLYAIKALIAQKKFDIASSILYKMLSLYPTDIAYLEQLFIVYKNTNDTRLKELYHSILILDPNNVLVRSNLK